MICIALAWTSYTMDFIPIQDWQSGYIKYSLVETYNQYTGKPIAIIAATQLLHTLFDINNKDLDFNTYKPGDKKIPYRIVSEFEGRELEEIRYEQLLPYAKPQMECSISYCYCRFCFNR
jgi:hypothetical protein